MLKKIKQWIAIWLSVFLVVTGSVPVAALDEETLYDYGLNQIYFWDPSGMENYCTVGGDCYIAGDTWGERVWSALRHVGFTPEQTAGLIGNIVHEGGTPTTQEYSYIEARNAGCKTAEGKPYTIHTDFASERVHHGACIGGPYSAGSEVAGIGIGPVQWTSHNRREGYLAKMAELGLSKYFEGDAYKKYGRLTDDQLKEKIEAETGSDSDYWALWCAAIKYIWTEMQDAYSGFFKNNTVAGYAGWAASSYERCSQCAVGGAQYNARIKSAEEYWNKYKLGAFAAVESGSAPVMSGNSVGTVASEDGSNVTIIGDSITNGARGALQEALPKAEIIAEGGKLFARGGSSENPSGLEILEKLRAEGKLRQVVVFALGTNSTVTKDDVNAVLNVIGPDKQVFFVTNYDMVRTNKYSNNNKLFSAAVDSYNNVGLVDWKNAVLTASSKPSDYIRDEGSMAVHLTSAGQKLFAETIKDAVTGLEISDTCEPMVDEELTFYYQSDKPWGPMAYGNCGGDTIANAGCGPTSLAMIITAMTGKRVTPDEIAKKAAASGYRVCGNGSSHAITNLARDYGLVVKDYGRPSIPMINKLLKEGVMFQVAGSGPNPFSGVGHFIGIRGITEDGKWLIFDSAHKGSGNNEREWNPKEIYPYVSSDWRGVSKK